MTSEAERIRLLKRHAKELPGITHCYVKNKLYFGEIVRKPIRRGNLLVMTTMVLPITEYGENDCWDKVKEFQLKRDRDMWQEFLDAKDAEAIEAQKKVTEAGDNLEANLMEAFKEKKYFYQTGGNKVMI